MEKRIKEIIDELKPYLNSDGGNIEFIKLDNDTVFIKLFGACSMCMHKNDTINDFILRTIQNEFPEIKEIVNVEL